MESHSDILDKDHLNWLTQEFFSDPKKQIHLKKGEILLHQNQINKRLYYVKEGLLVGYRNSGSGHRDEILRAEKNMFAGVHSFFSKSYTSYAELVADSPTQLSYIDVREFDEKGLQKISEIFVPVIVHELSSRQLLSQRVMIEKENALKNLLQAEKMATLGQMAAGLAHELNNAIGVLKNNTRWLSEQIVDFVSSHIDITNSEFLQQAIESGQTLSSAQVRERKQKLQKKYALDSHIAKKLAKLNLDEAEISTLINKEKFEDADKLSRFNEIGNSIHDIIVASTHAGHVLQSVKQLAVTQQDRMQIDVNTTIHESSILLKSLTRQVELDMQLNELPALIANRGELVQIWVNIIKNGCESIIQAKTQDPKLTIKSYKKNKSIIVEITDNGPGIRSEIAKNIFQPNFTTKKEGLSFGLGLGLSIVQRLIDSYNGEIKLESKPGETTFTIKLPIQ